MRFLKGVAYIFFLLGALAGSIWLAVPEVVAWLAASSLRGEVANITRLAAKPAHVEACRLPGEQISGQPVRAYQVRFVNEVDYVVEVVCGSVSKGKVEIDKGSLPFGAKKQVGYSGVKITLPKEEAAESNVVVGVLSRNWSVGYSGSRARIGRVFSGRVEDTGVIADNACSGWGYQCCSEVNQQGEGETLTSGVLDCPGSCFTSCLSKPIVTTFATDPVLDENRSVVLPSGGSKVLFSWSAQDIDGVIVNVRIDFGDGTEFESDLAMGTIEHEYSCGGGRCAYEAKITVIDDMGLESPDTRTSALRVIAEN